MSPAITIGVIATTLGSVTTLLSRLLYERTRRHRYRELSRRDHVRRLPVGSRIAEVSGTAIFIEVGASSTVDRGVPRGRR